MARKGLFEKFPRGHTLVIIEIHASRRVEKVCDILSGYFELLLQDACEILSVISRGKGIHCI